MFKCKVFGLNCPKALHLPLERPSAPAEIRIVTMAEFHKNGSKEPFLWNCAATGRANKPLCGLFSRHYCMLDDSLPGYLLLNLGLLMLTATALTEIKPLRVILKRQERSVSNQLLLGLIFGLLSISGTYTGLQFQGAVVNTRVISTVAAGLVGGPLSGVCAGLLSGVHRYFYNPAGFTSLACGVGTFCFGLIGAVFYRWLPRVTHRNIFLVGIAVLSELIQCGIILVMAKPFSAAVALEQAILLPKMAVNSVGLVIFMGMLDRLNRNLTFELVEQRSAALYVAQECLPYLREGLGNREALQKAADTVRRNLPNFQVAIADREEILVSSGTSLAGQPLPDFVRQAEESRKLSVIRNYQGEHHSRRFQEKAAIAAPLVWDQRAVGALILLTPTGPNLILEADMLTAESLAQLFSSMLELGELQHQVDLRHQAEFRALQSQINPHFLFNALNTISALCLTDPDRARETILVLARYFRQTLSINESFVTLAQELSNVDNYLFLTEARFEGTVHVTRQLPEDLEQLRLPPLILQPLVENAIRHGGSSDGHRYVDIRIQQDQTRAHIRISDRGHGFPPEVLAKFRNPDDPSYTGLFNVQKRLRSIYGDQCVFDIESTDHGSAFFLSIPLEPPAAAQTLSQGR